VSNANKAFSCPAIGLILTVVSLRGDEQHDNRLLDFTVVAVDGEISLQELSGIPVLGNYPDQ
jgi:hypothetical protein